MKMKNFVKDGQKLPMFGVGPYLVYGIGMSTAAAIALFHYVFKVGIMDNLCMGQKSDVLLICMAGNMPNTKDVSTGAFRGRNKYSDIYLTWSVIIIIMTGIYLTGDFPKMKE